MSASRSEQRHDRGRVGIDVDLLHEAVLLVGEAGHQVLGRALGVVLREADEDGQVAFGIGVGRVLAEEVAGEQLGAFLH